MKVLLSVGLLRAALGVAGAAKAKERKIPVQQACFSLSDFDFVDFVGCSNNFLGNVVQDMINYAGSDCQHDKNTEVQLIYEDIHGQSTDYNTAIGYLAQECEASIDREPCIDGLDPFDFENLAGCSESFLKTVAKDLKDHEINCGHSEQMEIQLLHRADQNNGTGPLATYETSIAWLSGICEGEIVRRSCLEGIGPFQNFEHIAKCSDTFLQSVVTDMKDFMNGGCGHDGDTETQLLYREVGLGETPSRNPLPAYDESIAWLVGLCEQQIHQDSCIGGMGNIDLVNIAACDQSYLEDIVHGKIFAEGCRHSEENEIQILYRDEHPPSTDLPAYSDAIAWFVDQCEQQIQRKSCIGGFQQISFAQIGNCAQNSVKNKVASLIQGTNCKHNAQMEIQVLYLQETGGANASVGVDPYTPAIEWLQERCHDVYGCSAMGIVGVGAGGTTHTECYYDSIVDRLEAKLHENCPHDIQRELELLTGETDPNSIKSYIDNMCAAVWAAAPSTTFTDIDEDFDAAFMVSYAEGHTYLNSETGNFQGTPNDAYPVDAASYRAGQNINDFYNTTVEGEGAATSVLRTQYADATVFDTFSNCENNAVMCCFGRDRQSNDNNGNCNDGVGNCEPDQANPGDNTNLCYVENDDGNNDTCVSYIDETEGDTHCHGFAWSDDPNDSISQFVPNNFFFVSLYDHMYTRGYVEPIDRITNPATNLTEFHAPMCHCVEEMPTVSRSDCTQIDAQLKIRLKRDPATHLLAVQVRDEVENTISINFNACKGYNPGTCTLSDDPATCANKNNDLASYAHKLTFEGKLSVAKHDAIFETLAGHDNPNANQNEAACEAAYCADPDCADDTNPEYTCRRRRLGAPPSWWLSSKKGPGN